MKKLKKINDDFNPKMLIDLKDTLFIGGVIKKLCCTSGTLGTLGTPGTPSDKYVKHSN